MIVFAGQDRRYTLPGGLQASGVEHVDGWELLALAQNGSEWAEAVLANLMPSDIEPGNYLGVPDDENEDILHELLREVEGGYELFDPETKSWIIPDETPRATVDITHEIASALYDAQCSDGASLALRFCEPLAWLPPSNDAQAAPMAAAAIEPDPTGASAQWKNFAVVDDLDHGAVLNVIRLAPGPTLEVYTGKEEWKEDNTLLADLQGVTPPLLVELDETKLGDVLRQVDEFYAANPTGPEEDGPVTASIEDDGYEYGDDYDEIEVEGEDGGDDALTAATASRSNKNWQGNSAADVKAGNRDGSHGTHSSTSGWDEEKHPRGEKGSSNGGKFVAVQKSLIKAGYLGKNDGKNGNGADGINGPKTEAAIRKWQKLHGRKVTGKATADEQRSITHPHEFASKKKAKAAKGKGKSKGKSASQSAAQSAAQAKQQRQATAQNEVNTAQNKAVSTTREVTAASKAMAAAAAAAKADATPENVANAKKTKDAYLTAQIANRRALAELKLLRAHQKTVASAAPLTAASATLSPLPGVSPDPRAEKLRRYWSTGGKGGLKIKWGLPGDWKRCVRQLTKYMGLRSKGYCNLMHKRNTGLWTGSKLNASAGFPAIEVSLLAAIDSRLWVNEADRKASPMKDGIYTEVQDTEVTMLDTLLAGGFPVAPPNEWFEDPKLEGPTPIRVGDDGRVSGHIATFDIAHIGMPGNVRAPRSRSKYAYFHTGDLVTASGAHIPVGQLTLAGGHAPLSADAGQAVKHYDDTASAIADIHVGEDRYGIWAAGAVRPDASPEQLRALRASAPSGDWRPINGSLELVAVCQVNVPGFPIMRARVASGMITALVAAGARPLAEAKLAATADAALAHRVQVMEAALVAAGALEMDDSLEAGCKPKKKSLTADGEEVAVGNAIPVGDEDYEPLAPVDTEEATPVTQINTKIEAARAAIKEKKRAELRARVHGTALAAAAPAIVPEIAAAPAPGAAPEATKVKTVPSTGSMFDTASGPLSIGILDTIYLGSKALVIKSVEKGAIPPVTAMDSDGKMIDLTLEDLAKATETAPASTPAPALASVQAGGAGPKA